MDANIPFGGFYNSIHDNVIERAIESLIEDASGEANKGLADRIWSEINTRDAMKAYVIEYVHLFGMMLSEETGVSIKFKFDEMTSPREYNFQTDRIFVKVSRDSVRAMFKLVDKTILTRVAAENHTSCSGFISFYNPDYTSWGALDKWDHNQIKTLLDALTEEFLDEEWEYKICEQVQEMCVVENPVYDGLTAEGKRIVGVADYLRKREERAWIYA